MNLPFTPQQFFEVFARYNDAVWPAQIGLNAVALACVALVFRAGAAAGRWLSALLALLWFWTAIAYHFAFFSRINEAAWLFGSVALAGGLAFLWLGLLQGRLRFSPARGWRGAIDGLLIVYALLVYPAVGVSPAITTRARPASACPVRRRSSPWGCCFSPRLRFRASLFSSRCSGRRWGPLRRSPWA